jgi:hypothetical protein
MCEGDVEDLDNEFFFCNCCLNCSFQLRRAHFLMESVMSSKS